MELETWNHAWNENSEFEDPSFVCSALIKDNSEILRKSTKAFKLKHSPDSSNSIQSLNGPLRRILANV